MEADVFEADTWTFHVQHCRIRRVHEADRLRNQLRRILHRAEIAHDAVELRHQSPEQEVEAQNQCQREGDSAGTDLAGQPKVDTQRCHRRDHHTRQQRH
ncbi:hypothetical protein D3C80_1640410 [compost metagenome]